MCLCVCGHMYVGAAEFYTLHQGGKYNTIQYNMEVVHILVL